MAIFRQIAKIDQFQVPIAPWGIKMQNKSDLFLIKDF